MMEETNLLGSYLHKRQKFYDHLSKIQEKYMQWFQDQLGAGDNNQLSLAQDFVDCNLDLSTLLPKLYLDSNLKTDIAEECSSAFYTAFNVSY